ncbi:DMT family transporter [Candidatus Entotheonella palauensis]|uniref:EamA domain-containing protein n=1 Tax=Candidatus Entotheonella gemina TaxID=1429439 RepID=W4M9A8_9BACT|nr:DMT family transporter [Candidatus Entotheonella palauensis]ETX06949.1 MAG: hypothetical protein ETSY2_14110 [Candidatus Entotheonella gemina]
MDTAAGEQHAARGTHRRGVILVLLAGTFWSISGIVVRLIEHAQPWQIVFYRSLTLMLALTVWISHRHRGQMGSAFRSAGGRAVAAGLCLSLAFTCWVFALTQTTVANALFLLTTKPFIAAILGRVILRERVAPITWVAMTLALIGVAIMVNEGMILGALWGDLMALATALSMSGFTIALRSGKSTDMFPAVWWGGGFATLIAAVMLGVRSQSVWVSGWDFGMCSVLGVVQIGFGLIAYTAGSRFLPAAELVLLSLIEVLLGPIWVWLGVGEVPSGPTLLGGVIVLTAVVWRAGHDFRSATPQRSSAP